MKQKPTFPHWVLSEKHNIVEDWIPTIPVLFLSLQLMTLAVPLIELVLIRSFPRDLECGEVHY